MREYFSRFFQKDPTPYQVEQMLAVQPTENLQRIFRYHQWNGVMGTALFIGGTEKRNVSPWTFSVP